jgi:hypothetical protein
MGINPLLVHAEGQSAMVADCRMVLFLVTARVDVWVCGV